jgi:hypothetical protein
MREIRAGSGLGDSIYLQSVARHMVMQGKQIVVRSNYPDVFRPIGVPVVQFHKLGNCVAAHYATRMRMQQTDQFQDMCITAGISGPVEMRLDWQPFNDEFLSGLKRPVIAVMLPRLPMDRTDGFGIDLMPNWHVMQTLIDKCDTSILQIGSGKAVHAFSGIDRDLSNKTSIRDVLDIASMVDGFIGTCSFMIPLAESLGKPYFCLWSGKGLVSETQYLRQITPQKIIHRKDLAHYAVDNSPANRIEQAFEAFLRQIAR